MKRNHNQFVVSQEAACLWMSLGNVGHNEKWDGCAERVKGGLDPVLLVNEIDKSKLNLCITLDFPQLFSAYGGPTNMSNEALKNTIETLLPIRHRIKGIHLWGKKRNPPAGRLIAHCGDLTSYFEDHQKKETFLDSLNNFLNDKQKRFLVPEVNSKSGHLHSIIDDLENAGIQLIKNG